MRVLWKMGFLAITLALLPAPAPAQSLGEAAAREKERREKEGKQPPAKVFTDNDLGGRAGSGTVSQPGSSTGSTSPSTTEDRPAPSAEGKGEPKLEPTEEELRAQKETVWRKKREVVQDEINRLTDAVDKLQTLANDMTGTLYGPGRASLIAQLETGKKSLAQAQQMLVDLEEEGRLNRYR